MIPEYDAIVVGGGPSGAATAIRLALDHRRVLVLERDVFPRFHIGESQVPWSDEVFRALDLGDKVSGAGFTEKWGAAFMSPDGSVERYADFTTAAETPCPRTYHVSRAEFDHLLLTHAAARGAEVRYGARALDVTFAADGVTVDYEHAGSRSQARAAVIVDASGRTGFLIKRRALRQYDPILRNVSMHAQYEGVPRRSGRRAGDLRTVMRTDRGWYWFIPVSPTRTSVGVVLPKDRYAQGTSEPLDAALERLLDETPAARLLMQSATRVTPTRFDADYSYGSSRLAGDRWVAVGDAGAFLDPIFSTGVLLALQSGLDAAAAIARGLAAGDLSARRFRTYERTVRRRFAHFRRFAVGFYDPAFRQVFFQEQAPFRIREAVLSVLAGNWRPSLATRIRIQLFFLTIAIQRRIPFVVPVPELTE